ncbi:MAG TPA: M15 family metallopeptidase [Gammaproteobacteria bacterium]|nr:M15 family metallopeptidase [Gammaproteobacteria bacterium]
MYPADEVTPKLCRNAGDPTDELLDSLGIPTVLVSARNLQRWPDAKRLEIAEIGKDGREHRLEPRAAHAWQQMKAAAIGDGETLYIVSAFRSAVRQAEIIRRKLQAQLAIEEILSICAPPGYSEHHTGRAVDLSAPGVPALTTAFEETSAFRWLCANAPRFGFRLSYPSGNEYGYQYEPWHWCHNGARQG